MNVTPLRTALGAIVDGDATLRTLCGRTTNLLVDWGSRHNATAPFVALLVVVAVQDAGSDYWRVSTQMEIAVPAAALDTADAIADQLQAILTHTNLWAQGVDAAPVGLLRHRDVPATDELLAEGVTFKLFELDLFVK